MHLDLWKMCSTEKKGGNFTPLTWHSSFRGRSQPMLKIYCPLLTTYPPPVDICEGIPLLIKENLAFCWYFQYVPPTFLPTSYCQHNCERPRRFFLYFVACMLIPVRRSSVILLWYRALALKAERMPDKLSRAFTIVVCVHY